MAGRMVIRISDMIYIRGDSDVNEDMYSTEVLQKLIIDVSYGRVVILLLVWSEEVKPACHNIMYSSQEMGAA